MSHEYLLLGLLNQGALSGYDLHKQFSGLLEQGWGIDRRQVYYLLHKMEKSGWLDVEVIPQEDNPTKKVYHINADGQAALYEWIKTPLGPEEIPFNWMGQLFLGYEVTHREIITILQGRCADLEMRIEEGKLHHRYLESLLAAGGEIFLALLYQIVSMHHGFTYSLNELRWARNAIDWLGSLDAQLIAPDELARTLIKSIKDMRE